jgi:hypothetical protein
LAVLAAGQAVTDRRSVAVVMGRFHEQSPGVDWAGFGDRSLPALGVRP